MILNAVVLEQVWKQGMKRSCTQNVWDRDAECNINPIDIAKFQIFTIGRIRKQTIFFWNGISFNVFLYFTLLYKGKHCNKKKKKRLFETDGFENLYKINKNSAKNLFLSFSACLVHLPLCIFTLFTIVLFFFWKSSPSCFFFISLFPCVLLSLNNECAI